MSDEVFYVYEHWRPDTDVCFYVGKGKRKRVHLLSRKENKHHSRVVAKLANAGLCVEVRLVSGGLSETDAFAMEIERIAFWRAAGVDLCNATTGGEGAAGCVRSDDFKRSLSAHWTGKKRPWLSGRKHSDEHRAKISAGMTGRVISDETRRKISDSQKGKPRPELVGRKLSPEGVERLRNRVFTPEHRAKISAAKKGISPRIFWKPRVKDSGTVL